MFTLSRKMLLWLLVIFLIGSIIITIYLFFSSKNNSDYISLRATSEIKNYSLSINNEKEFIKLMTKLGLSEKRFGLGTNYLVANTHKNILVILTDKPQPWNTYVSENPKKTIASSGYTYDPNTKTIVIYVHLDPEIILAAKPIESSEQRISTFVLYQLHLLSLPYTFIDSLEFSRIVKPLRNNEINIFTLKKQ